MKYCKGHNLWNQLLWSIVNHFYKYLVIMLNDIYPGLKSILLWQNKKYDTINSCDIWSAAITAMIYWYNCITRFLPIAFMLFLIFFRYIQFLHIPICWIFGNQEFQMTHGYKGRMESPPISLTSRTNLPKTNKP